MSFDPLQITNRESYVSCVLPRGYYSTPSAMMIALRDDGRMEVQMGLFRCSRSILQNMDELNKEASALDMPQLKELQMSSPTTEAEKPPAYQNTVEMNKRIIWPPQTAKELAHRTSGSVPTYLTSDDYRLF